MCVWVCVWTCVRARVHTLEACVHAFVCTCLHVCVSVRAHTGGDARLQYGMFNPAASPIHRSTGPLPALRTLLPGLCARAPTAASLHFGVRVCAAPAATQQPLLASTAVCGPLSVRSLALFLPFAASSAPKAEAGREAE